MYGMVSKQPFEGNLLYVTLFAANESLTVNIKINIRLKYLGIDLCI